MTHHRPPRCSRPSTPPTAASCRWPRAVGRVPRGRHRLYGASGQDNRIAGVLAMMGANTQKLSSARPATRWRFAKLDGDRDRRDDLDRQGRDAPAQPAPAAPGRLWPRHLGRRPQGRGQAHQRHRQAGRGGSLAQPRPQPRHPRDGAVGPGRDASARGDRAPRHQVRRQGRHPAAAHRLQGDDPQAGDGARPPQEADRRPRPVRRRRGGDQAAAARRRASRSPTRSPAAWCPSSTSPRSKPASANTWTTGRWASPSSISRSICRTAAIMRSIPPKWRSRRRAASP
jgi:hypothetical protein